MYSKNLIIIVATLLLSVFAVGRAEAQMTDEQVMEYVKEGLRTGKGEQQIGRELVARGVTQSQLQRLKTRQQTDGRQPNSSADKRSRIRRQQSIVDQTLEDQQRERYRDPQEELLLGNLDEVGRSMQGEFDSADSLETDTPKRIIFGHNIFSGRTMTFEPNENMATPEHYRLGPGDEVIIDIWGASEDSFREEISPEGNIMVSQIGPVYLNGLTIREANNKLRGIFAQKYAGVSGEDPDSDIRVTLGQIRSIQVNVLGEVATPGTYRLSSFASVFNALYRAGGVTEIGSLRGIRIIRGGRELAPVDLYSYLFEGRLSNDSRLEEGDVIIVPTYEKLVEITGNVKRPMWYELKEGESLAALLNYAGGFTGDAYRENARLIRQTGREYRIFNVADKDFGTFLIDDGDAVEIEATLDRFANRVEVRGAVFRPGMYELGEGARTVRALVELAAGVQEDAFLDRVLLFRETDDLRLEVQAINLRDILSGRATDIALRRNDVLLIQSSHELEERGPLTIYGEVARPDTYPYAKHMTIEDLILQAGGLLDGASTARVEVSRRIKDPRSTTTTNRIGKTFTFAISEGLKIEGADGFELEPYDVVEVRRSPGYREQQRVEISGEALFPGGYALQQKNERLSSLVKRAGGITEDAYPRGARLIRRLNDEERAVRDAVLEQARNQRGASDSVSLEKLELGDFYTVGIELDKALAHPDSSYDVVLREGDRLVIPEYTGTVKVSGDVLYPNTVVYLDGKKLKHYIAQAGGFGSRAKRSKTYVIYMNGTVAQTGTFRKPRIEPGCEIVVPSKRERRRTSLAEILGLTTSIGTLGMTAATIANMSK